MFLFTGPLSSLILFLEAESPLKMMKNIFYLNFSRDAFNHVEKRLDK